MGFWFENKPSGNPDPWVQLRMALSFLIQNKQVFESQDFALSERSDGR
jgi:hypothetical protein